MKDTSNLRGIKKDNKAVVIDYQFVTFDLLTFFHFEFTFICKTIYCLVPLKNLRKLLTYIITSDLMLLT